MAEIIQFGGDEFAVECEHCGCQVFFIVMDENDDITHFECGNENCKGEIEFNTIVLTNGKGGKK